MTEFTAWAVAITAVALASLWATFLVARCFPSVPASLFWPLSFGMSIGGFTLLLAAVGFVALHRSLVVLVLLLLWVGSALLGARRPLKTAPIRSWLSGLGEGRAQAWLILALLAVLGVVVAQATYYPFVGDDEISRYAYFAKFIVASARLTAQVRGYPMLLPLAYATTFFVSGFNVEQAAKLFPVLFAVMTVLATYALGRRWFGRVAGWAAAFVLSATPLFIHWAPDGYVDIPSALYFVLGAYALDEWRQGRELRWGILTGLVTGLALWTKQAGFAMLPPIGIVVLLRLFAEARNGSAGRALRVGGHGAAMLAGALIAGGWWYVRNAFYDGWRLAVPGPGSFYTQLATRAPTLLLPFLGYFSDFGFLAAPLYILGLAGAAIMLVRRHDSAGALGWSLLWCAPYTILWWWAFSYDARFLLTVLPFYAIVAGASVASALQAVESEFPQWKTALPKWHSPALIILIIAITAVGVYQARLGGLIQWITHPTADYAERLERAKGDMYPTVEFLRDHTASTDRIFSMDPRLGYYLFERPIRFGYPFHTADVQDYDYIVVGSWAPTVYAGLGTSFDELRADLDNPELFQLVFAGPDSSIVVYRVLGS